MDRIKELIKEKGMTQEQFASKLGVTRISVVKTLAGNPSVDTLRKMANVLGVPMWQLFATKDEVIGEQSNTITCPKCGARFKLEEDTPNE